MTAISASLPEASGTLPGPASLAATRLIDSNAPEVIEFAREHVRGVGDRERAVSLYYAVRDGFRYDPYRVDFSERGMQASGVLRNGFGWCIPKAALLTAVCRAVGIPARPGYADVRNHLSTERMRATMGTDVFIWHGYTDIWLDGTWRKATPAFNIELCDRFGLHPLEFDGRADSIYHPFDRNGHRHMEYVAMRGAFDDMPLARIVHDFRETYRAWFANPASMTSGDFIADVARESS